MFLCVCVCVFVCVSVSETPHLQQAIINASALPPRESINSLVSLESLYGMCELETPRVSRSANALITCSRQDNVTDTGAQAH